MQALEEDLKNGGGARWVGSLSISIGFCSVGRVLSRWNERISPSRSLKGGDVLVEHVDRYLCVQITVGPTPRSYSRPAPIGTQTG